jgi:hypothetical protein
MTDDDYVKTGYGMFPSPWRLIETAKLDEVIIIHAMDVNRTFVGSLLKAYDGRIFASLDASDCQTGCGDTGTPTHWMPLPPGPTK